MGVLQTVGGTVWGRDRARGAAPVVALCAGRGRFTA